MISANAAATVIDHPTHSIRLRSGPVAREKRDPPAGIPIRVATRISTTTGHRGHPPDRAENSATPTATPPTYPTAAVTRRAVLPRAPVGTASNRWRPTAGRMPAANGAKSFHATPAPPIAAAAPTSAAFGSPLRTRITAVRAHAAASDAARIRAELPPGVMASAQTAAATAAAVAAHPTCGSDDGDAEPGAFLPVMRSNVVVMSTPLL